MIYPLLTVKRVCLIRHQVSFRMQHEGLLAVAYRLGLNPYEGDLVVFIGRRKNAIKLLFTDKNGIWVGYKKFHQGIVSRHFKFLEDETATIVAPSEISLLIEGSRFIPD